MKYNVRSLKNLFCKRSVTRGYKGFKKGLICRDKQYKVGETYEEQGEDICEEGMMHFCENPLDVLEYYPAFDPGTGEPNEFAEVEAIGRVVKKGNKSAANKLRVVRKISLEELIKATTITVKPSKVATTEEYSHAVTTKSFSNAATTEEYSHAVTLGEYAHATAAGNSSNVITMEAFSNAAATGDWSHVVTTRSKSQAATVGDHSETATIGNFSNATTAGYESYAVTSGYRSHAITAGNISQAIAFGENSIAAALGVESKAKAALGNWIVLAEYKDFKQLNLVKAVQVDGKKIKADTFYKLENGEFVEA